jgi:ABC-type polysaccharide/polyol phosphate transport system ATPase subunit
VDASPTKSENNEINPSGRFYDIKEKQSRKENSSSKLTWNAWVARLSSCTKSLKFKDHVILNEFTFDFQRGERIGIIGKTEQENLLS